MTGKTTILLADDHNVLRQGIAQMLEAQSDMKVVAQADNGSDAVALARSHQPRIALLDINIPEMDGVEAARRITAEFPETSVIILTMYRRDEYVFEAIKAGANGYLLKEVDLDELLEAIRAAAQGEAVIDPAIASRLLAEFRQPQKTEKTPESALSDRDVNILRLVAEDLSNHEIAEQLFISEIRFAIDCPWCFASCT
ncbi:MAG TPA: response regulator transcription factor [Anaerolineae bacterium]|jgi:DNA-binding NarL/FixJ family response regulator|nr:response regulator transcription factor [Anaerolineae bacterium]